MTATQTFVDTLRYTKIDDDLVEIHANYGPIFYVTVNKEVIFESHRKEEAIAHFNELLKTYRFQSFYNTI